MKAVYPHCAERLFGRAHAIEPTALRLLVEGPAGRRILSGEKTDEAAADSGFIAIRKKRMAMVEADPVSVANGCGEYALTSEGVAIVPVMGILSQRFDWLAAMCGWTTYEGLAATFEAMLSDYRVRAILMDVESPGGEAAGMPDAADIILAARAVKPVWAVANTFAASAAYAIAGAAEMLFVPRLAQVGSIGAVCVHVDQSVADAAYGERFTAVYSGARKIDGWQHAPLSEGAQSAMQKGVDHCRDVFAQLVGRQGRMTAAEAIATEAAMYHDNEAVASKLADRVGSFDVALAELSARVSGRSATPSAQGTKSMKVENPETIAAAAAPATLTAATPVDAPATVDAAAPGAAGQGDDEDDAPATPEVGDVCATCGQPVPAAAAAAEPSASSSVDPAVEMMAVLDLCSTQGVDLATAKGFIAAKTPLPQVREKIAADQAAKADANRTITTTEKPLVNSGWDDVTARVNKEFGVQPK